MHEILTGIWNPLISGQIVNSFGQGKCTFDCQSRNLKNYASGAHVSTSPCMLRTEILITVNISCIWTFHTNSLLHEYLFLMHVHNYMQLTINTFINDSVSFTGEYPPGGGLFIIEGFCKTFYTRPASDTSCILLIA